MSYVYPKNRLEIIDGSLRPIASVPEDVVLVIERSYSGPSNTVYLVDDLSTAKTLYGDKSPLINLANKTRIGTAANIALYRIGGAAAEYVNIFGDSTSLRVTEESVTAAKNLSVYIGPEPKNPNRDCVIIFEGTRIIYSNVLGAEVSSAKVVVQGFNKATNTLKIGTVDAPVAFTELMTFIGGEGTSTATAQKLTVDGADWIAVDPTTISGFDSATSSIDSIRLTTLTGTPVTTTKSNDGTKLLVNLYVDGTSEVVKEGENLNATFNKKLTDAELKDKGIKFIPGKDAMNATNQELYEILDQALDQLELIPTKALVVGDYFNVPNVAEGSTDANRLNYVLKGEDDEGYPTYEWSEFKYVYQLTDTTTKQVGETTDITKADLDLNGQPIVVRQYNEVDFTHRLGMFAYGKLDEGNYLNIIIGAKGPIARTPKVINEWIGTSPIYDLTGNIVQNGTGLLGHRLMVGTTNYAGGYYATANGFVDGEPLVDRTGFPIDLGKHISVVVSQVASITYPGVVTSAAAAYAGLVSSLTAGTSTTNKPVPEMALVFDIKESKRKALSEAGYVVFQDKVKGLTVYSGDLATRENSDYDYISTAITIAEISKLITDVTDPYIGQGLDFIILTALKTALTTALANAQKAGWMISFDFRIRRDGPNTLLIPFVIEAKDELRQISNVVRLSRSDTSTVEI